MKVKRMLAATTAIVSAVVGMSSFSAFALDEAFLESFSQRVVYPSQEEWEAVYSQDAVCSDGDVDAYSTNSNSTSTAGPFYYAPYDYYTRDAISPTTHFVAILTANPKEDTTTPVEFDSSQNVYFYVNANLVDSDYTDFSHFVIGRDYQDYLTIKSTSVRSIDEKCTRLIARVTATGNADAITDAIRYKITFSENADESFDQTEYDLNEAFSYGSSTMLSTSKGKYFTKCTYSLGDVNRDGVVDEKDSQILSSFMVMYGTPDPSRTEKEQECDMVAFGLAADCNQDEVVSMVDTIVLNKYLAGNGTLG